MAEAARDRLARGDPLRLVLVGMMGSGKTTVGRLLAEATGRPYLDNDELLALVAGRTASGLAADSEAGLRAAESAALRLGLATPAPCIVGAAAGTILDEANRQAMAVAGTVVWLRAWPATLARRAAGDSHRPWLSEDALAWFTGAVQQRDPLYASIADVIVDVDGLAPAMVVQQLVQLALL